MEKTRVIQELEMGVGARNLVKWHKYLPDQCEAVSSIPGTKKKDRCRKRQCSQVSFGFCFSVL